MGVLQLGVKIITSHNLTFRSKRESLNPVELKFDSDGVTMFEWYAPVKMDSVGFKFDPKQ